jgi:hypothetical protein
MDTIPQPPVYSRKDLDLFRKRHTGTIAFVTGVLLFFLPFAEFKCGNVAIAGNTGIGMATGQNWKLTRSFGTNEFMSKMDGSKKGEKDLMKDGPNIFAIAALSAGLFGIAIAFANVKWRSMAGMCAGLLAVVMLIALLIQFKLEMKSMMGKGGKGDDSLGMDIGGIIKIQFTVWYYLSLLSFIAAAFFNYMRDKIALREAMESAIDFEFQKKEVN